MKVKSLNGAIRAASPLRINFHVGNSTALIVEITKQSALAAVAEAFPDRNAETGLCINEEGFFTRDQNAS